MKIVKKIVSTIAAISMLATSLVAMNVVVASADELPTVTATLVVGKDNTMAGTDLGLKFTFSNLTANSESLNFDVVLPSSLTSEYDESLSELLALGDTINTARRSPFANGFEVMQRVGDVVSFAWLTDGSSNFGNSDYFELDFNGATDYEGLKALNANALKVTNVKMAIIGLDNAITQDNNEIKVVDPVPATPDPTPTTPEYVYNGKDTKWGAATFVGDYSTADDKAIAVKAEVKPGQKVENGALVDNTYTGLVWKAVKADGTAVGYEQSGLSITGNGTYVFGLAIDGVSQTEVQTNGFGIAVK